MTDPPTGHSSADPTAVPTADPPAGPPAGPTRGLAACSTAGDPVRVDLVWRDPVTGAELDLDIVAAPGLVDRLLGDGFRGSRSAPRQHGGGPFEEGAPGPRDGSDGGGADPGGSRAA